MLVSNHFQKEEKKRIHCLGNTGLNKADGASVLQDSSAHLKREGACHLGGTGGAWCYPEPLAKALCFSRAFLKTSVLRSAWQDIAKGRKRGKRVVRSRGGWGVLEHWATPGTGGQSVRRQGTEEVQLFFCHFLVMTPVAL